MNAIRQRQIIENLASLLYDFLPGSGNSRTAFPLAAQAVGVAQYWIPGSKRPAIVQLLIGTLQHERGRFRQLIVEVVQQAMSWRLGKGNPLTREEIDRLNQLLADLSLPIDDLRAASFLDGLPRARAAKPDPPPVASVLTQTLADELAAEHMALSKLNPHPRGFAFEKFLTKLFDAHGLVPRSAFRLVGEQIDGSFVLDNETYLVEAKWQNPPVGADALYAFDGKVSRKASWTRGLFVSNSGFSQEGLQAFRGQPTKIVCMDGLDLHEIVVNRAPFGETIKAKVRRAAETGRTHVPFQELRLP